MKYKYIDAEKLKAEIEGRRLSNRYITTEGYEQELYELIDSLQQEQPEVDLEEEIDNYIGEHFSEAHDGVLLSDASRMELMITDVAPMARYFYELGLKAKKEV